MSQFKYNAKGQKTWGECSRCGNEKKWNTSIWCPICISNQRNIRQGNIERSKNSDALYREQMRKRHWRFYKAKEFIDRIQDRNKKFSPYLMISLAEMFELIDIYVTVNKTAFLWNVMANPDKERSIMWNYIVSYIRKNDPNKPRKKYEKKSGVK